MASSAALFNSIQETWEGRGGGIDQTAVRTYTRVWEIFTVSELTDTQLVREAPGLPVMFQVYSTDTSTDLGARVTNIDPAQDPVDPRKWMVTVKYSSKYEDPARQEPNPLRRPSKISYRNTRSEEAVQKDVEDLLVANSAGDAYDPPQTRRVNSPLIVISKNLPSYNPDVVDAYQNTWNTTRFLGYDIGKVLCAEITAESEVYEGDYVYWPHVFTFEVKKAGWNVREILDAGFMELVGGRLRPILRDGVAVSKPSLLNGAGLRLTPGAAPKYQRFKFYLGKDLNRLPIF